MDIEYFFYVDDSTLQHLRPKVPQAMSASGITH